MGEGEGEDVGEGSASHSIPNPSGGVAIWVGSSTFER